MKQNVEIKSFQGAESPHFSDDRADVTKMLPGSLFEVRASDGVISVKERQKNRGGPGYYLSTISCCEAICVTEGKSWSHSSTHTVLKEAGDYPWRLKTFLSSSVIPSHKSVLSHPLFTDKTTEHCVVQGRKGVTSSPLRNRLFHTPLLLLFAGALNF